MPSQFVWKSYTRFTKWSESLWLPPLTFDGVRREFKVVGVRVRGQPQLIPWYLCSSLVICTGGLMTSLLLSTFLHSHTHSHTHIHSHAEPSTSVPININLNILELVFSILYVATSILTLVLLHLSLILGAQWVEALNQLLKLDKTLTRWGFLDQLGVDYVGLFMHGFLVISNLIPVLLSIFGVYENIDVLYLFLNKCLNIQLNYRSIFITSLRFMWSLITVTEIWKQIGFFSLSLLLALQIVSKALEIKTRSARALGERSKSKSKVKVKVRVCGVKSHSHWRKLYMHWGFFQAYKVYRMLQIIIFSGLNPTLIFFLPYTMAMGLLLCILCDFTTISLHERIESALLVVMPAVSFGVKFIILTLLPEACGVHEGGLRFISEWGKVAPLLTHRQTRRKLRVLRPLRFDVGPLFHCQRSTKTTYFSVIMYYTVTAVISFK